MEYPILQHFAHAHLPPRLAAVSKLVGDIALEMANELPPGPEVSAGMRKLLEAKDCFVRAELTRGSLPPPSSRRPPSPSVSWPPAAGGDVMTYWREETGETGGELLFSQRARRQRLEALLERLSDCSDNTTVVNLAEVLAATIEGVQRALALAREANRGVEGADE